MSEKNRALILPDEPTITDNPEVAANIKRMDGEVVLVGPQELPSNRVEHLTLNRRKFEKRTLRLPDEPTITDNPEVAANIDKMGGDVILT